jgi:hypothetical protein
MRTGRFGATAPRPGRLGRPRVVPRAAPAVREPGRAWTSWTRHRGRVFGGAGVNAVYPGADGRRPPLRPGHGGPDTVDPRPIRETGRERRVGVARARRHRAARGRRPARDRSQPPAGSDSEASERVWDPATRQTVAGPVTSRAALRRSWRRCGSGRTVGPGESRTFDGLLVVASHADAVPPAGALCWPTARCGRPARSTRATASWSAPCWPAGPAATGSTGSSSTPAPARGGCSSCPGTPGRRRRTRAEV